jgi:hypothetical protein
VRGSARVYGQTEPDAGRAIALHADALSIDADRMRCNVVWRGAFPLAREEDLATLQVVAGIETADQPLRFPATRAAAHAAVGSVPPAAHTGGHPLGATLAIDVNLLAKRGAATPFEQRTKPPSIPAPAPPRRSDPPLRSNATGETMAFDVSTLLPPATPFEGKPSPAARVDAPRPPSGSPPALPTSPAPRVEARAAPKRSGHPLGETLAIDLRAVPQGPAVPFTPAPPSPPRAPSREALPPATPFEQARFTPPPSPEGPVTVDLARLAAPRPLSIGEAAVRRPSAPPPPLAAPVAAPPPRDAGASPQTLGAFFLAAMARAGGYARPTRGSLHPSALSG